MSAVVAEYIYATQVLIEKEIITRDEIKEKRNSFANPNPQPSEGGSVQSEDAEPDADGSGYRQRGISEASSDRGASDADDGSTDDSPADEQGDPAPPAGEG